MLVLMKDILKYCEDTINKTVASIKSTEALSKQNMEREEYRNIKEVVLRNEETTKRTLKQREFKKLNYQKYKLANDKILQPNEIML